MTLPTRVNRWPRTVCVLQTPVFKPGDPAPSGYLAWHEWARVQYRAGLRQSRCACCGCWFFPQEQHTARSVDVRPGEKQ